MKKTIDLNTQIKINYLEKDNFIIYNIDINNDFISIKDKGITQKEKFDNFLLSPTQKNLNILNHSFSHKNIIFMKKSLLKDLQNGKKLFSNVLRHFDNLYILTNRPKFIIVQQELENVKQISDINDNFNIESLNDFEMLHVDVNKEVLFNLNDECVYFQPSYVFDIKDYEKLDISEKKYTSEEIKIKMKSLKIKQSLSYKNDSVLHFIMQPFSKEQFKEAFKLAEEINDFTNETLGLILIALKELDDVLGFETFILRKDVNASKFSDLEKVLLKIKIENKCPNEKTNVKKLKI